VARSPHTVRRYNNHSTDRHSRDTRDACALPFLCPHFRVFEVGTGAVQALRMPENSRFLGIVIGMFYDEHRPPHFHVRYGEHEASVRIDDLTVSDGRLSPRVLGLVVEWALRHRKALMTNWTEMEAGAPFKKIAPLE
jgi:hypothetical protein